MHPDGYTFVSVVDGKSDCTFTFSTMFGWERHGDWILPFFGRGHFDPELNACVGISRYPDIRHICAGARRRRQGGNACPGKWARRTCSPKSLTSGL